MQILDIGLWAEISYGIVKMIFGTAMRIYDILLELAKDSSVLNAVNITANLYVLAIVFMLFRVAISLVKMLINPESINDKQAGAGKMLTRVVVSIVMLIVFSPTGILFNKDANNINNEGFLPRIEHALISDENSILYKAMSYEKIEPEQEETKDELGRTIVNFSTILPFTKYFYDDVYARANDDGTLTCWFYKAPVAFDKDNGGTGKAAEFKPIKVTFSEKKLNKGNTIKVTTDKSLTLYASFEESETEYTVTNPETNEQINIEYDISPSKKKIEGVKYSKFWGATNTKIKNAPKMCGHWLMQEISYKNDKGWYLGYDPDKNEENVYRGYSSLDAVVKQMGKDYDLNDKLSEEGKKELSDLGKAALDSNKAHYQKGYSKESLKFGTALLGCFEECNDTDKEMNDECKKIKKDQFDTSSSDEITKLIENERMDLSFMIAVIVGIALVVYLIILCVDIVIRGFKLMLLEALAPIPIVSYIDPNDKIFKQWMKMLVSTYVDLFIKIFTINIGVQLISIIVQSDTIWSGNLFKQFLVLVGVLVFVKIVPSFISKIFGLDSLGGSFKDIVGMGKAALGFGAGAIAGAGAGLITGASAMMATQGGKNRFLAGLQGLGSGFSGLAKGAGAGAKGNILGGAKNVSAQNANRRNLYHSGVTPMEALGQGILSKFNADYASRKDREVQAQNDKKQVMDNFAKHKSDMQSTAMDSKFMKSVMAARKNGFNLGDDEVEYLRDKWIDAQLSGTSGTDFVRDLTAPGEKYSDDFASLFADDRFAFDYTGGFSENGKKEALITSMSKANSDLSDSKLLSDATHVTSVDSFAALDTATKSAKQVSSSIEREVYEQTEGSSKYRSARTVRDSNSGGKKQ